MSPLLTLIAFVMIPASVLPIITAWFLRRYRHEPSQALRDRWHVSLALAALGAVTGLLAIGALTDIELGTGFWAAFGVVIIAADVVSGKWLLDYYRGNFYTRPPGEETALERQDRRAGNYRRELQADDERNGE